MFLGIDWGGTRIKAGLVDSKGKILEKRSLSSKNFKEKDVFLNQVASLVKEFSAFKIKGVGIGAPGIIDTKKGFIYYLPNISGWENYSLQSELKRKLKLPVFVENDANLFALAEVRLGAGKGLERAIFLTLGTGLGGALISGGKIVKGQTSASEIGHFPISLNGRKCGCGGTGCIETFVGNNYLLSRYKKLNKKTSSSLEVKDIYMRALQGESQAIKVWEEFSFALGMFLSGLINAFNPQTIIFGGGVSGAFKVFKPLVEKVIKKQAMFPQVIGLKLVKAKLKEPGVIGAALLVKDNLT